tara:strand:+ start:3596 stop:3871 length:276 start_codon:yes stop_codon:yes gene_type:complete
LGRRASRQVALSTTKDKGIIIGDPTRISLTILNEDTGINVLIYESDTADGFIILPQTSFTVMLSDGEDPTLPLALASASGTPNIRIWEAFA